METNSKSLKLLVIDDERSLREALCLNLNQAGYQVSSTGDGKEALAMIDECTTDIILCDLRIPNISGYELIEAARLKNPTVGIIMMSAFGGQDTALEALRAGASDFIQKPFELEDLILALKKLAVREHLEPSADPGTGAQQKYSFSNIIAQSKSMRDIFETVKRLAQFNTTVLVTGESGTGKELIARAIHHNSPRRGKSFVAINCGAIPENLIESELFGHKAGAFTDATRDKRGLFEEASGGTIFLDEIGELPLHLQVKLLRVLQEQQMRRVGDEQLISIDVRVIAATLRDLELDVQNGRFRDDLFYRLNVVSIHIPPLRERPDDIPVLINSFIKKHNKRLHLNCKGIEPEALTCLMQYPWKGNVRELENSIERALVMSDSEHITLAALPDKVRKTAQNTDQEPLLFSSSEGELSIKKSTRSLEINLIQRALKKTHGNRTHAAKILEISHRALLYKLKEYGMAKAEEAESEQEDTPAGEQQDPPI